MIVFLAATSNLDICRMRGRQKNVVKKKDLAVWEGEYGGITAEGIAKRVINKYDPSSEALSLVGKHGRFSFNSGISSFLNRAGNLSGNSFFKTGCFEYQEAVRSSSDEFTTFALFTILDKCFNKEQLDTLILKCIEKDCVAFALVDRTKSRTKHERLKLLCNCFPSGCENAADLFRYLVEVYTDLKFLFLSYSN